MKKPVGKQQTGLEQDGEIAGDGRENGAQKKDIYLSEVERAVMAWMVSEINKGRLGRSTSFVGTNEEGIG